MTCPMCTKTTVQAFRPFCSKRCADLDLAKWFNGSYAVPSNDPDDIEDPEGVSETPDGASLHPDKPH